ACLDAWLTYPDWDWAGAQATEPGAPAPQSVFFVPWELGGCDVPSRLQASRTLTAPPGDRVNPLAHLFDEQNDGIIRVADGMPTEGYWRFASANKTLTNARTGERVTLTGGSTKDGLEFEYADHEVRAPFTVTVAVDASRGNVNTTWSLIHPRGGL